MFDGECSKHPDCNPCRFYRGKRRIENKRLEADYQRLLKALHEFRTLTTFDMRTEKWKKVVDEVDKVLTENGLPVPEPHPLDY